MNVIQQYISKIISKTKLTNEVGNFVFLIQTNPNKYKEKKSVDS